MAVRVASKVATLGDLRRAVEAMSDLPDDLQIRVRCEVAVGQDSFDWVFGSLRLIQHEEQAHRLILST